MAKSDNHAWRYTVHASGAIAETIRKIHRRAKLEGRGDKVIAAFTDMLRRLRQDPKGLGEPFYRLSALGLDVRTCVIRPLAVDFAVHEEKRLVFLKGVKLLTELA
jgi:hypothetical protein